MTRLVDAGLVDASWNSGDTKGVVATSVAAIGVEKGNPLGINIKGWDALVKPGVKITMPDPAPSGSARWNILDQVVASGGSEADAKKYLTTFFDKRRCSPGQRA